MTVIEASQFTKEQIARAFGVPAHLLVDPDRPTAPRSWALLLTSENHGTVGPVGSTFPHAGEKHERVQVVEIVSAGTPPALGVDLAGLVRFGFSDLDGESEQLGVVADAAPSVETSEAMGIEEDREAIVGRALRAAQAWANEEYVCARNLGKGGPGTHEACAARQAECIAAIQALAAPVAAQAGQVAVPAEILADIDEVIRWIKQLPTATQDRWKSLPKLRAVKEALTASPALAQQAPAQAAPLPVQTAQAEPIECWSHNEEDFNAQSLGELIDTHELQPGATVWVGEAVHPDPASLFNTDWLIENMGEAAYDIAGEHGGEDYPNVSDEQIAELEALVVGWIAKCAPPSFWTVKNVRTYVLTPDDCGAQASTPGERQEGGDRG